MDNFLDLRRFDFQPLSKVKARLSEFIQKLVPQAKRVVITTNGRPTAVLMAYQDYLLLIEGPVSSQRGERIISIKDWKQSQKNRQAVRSTILDLFDVPALSRKGQKAYKKEVVREFNR